MRAIELRRELERFDPGLPIGRAWTPPSSWYVEPAFADLEQDHVFKRTWHPVARLEQFRETGAFVSGILADEPWVVVRAEDGALSAFHNTCRHKGHEVVQGSGTACELVCGYHAWSYDLDGRLRRAPQMAGVEDFDRATMSLDPIALETWGRWVFLNLGRHPQAFGPALAPLAERLERTQWQRLRFVEGRVWDIACNWKVYVDNYLDGGYHIPHKHPSLDAQLDMRSYGTRLFDTFSIQSSRSATRADERIAFESKVRIGPEALYVWLFPNFMLNRYGPCLDTNYVVPVGPEQCRVHYEFYFLETEGADAQQFIAESIEQSAVTQREDIAICESVQVGLRSGRYDRGRYAPRVEMGEFHFHGLLAQRLSHAFGASMRQSE